MTELVTTANTLADAEESLKSLLKKLDDKIGQDEMTPVDVFDLETARSCVSKISEHLKEHASLDSILIDKDIRNVIRFIRLTRETFIEDSGKKVEKKITKVANEKAKQAKSKAMMSMQGRLAGFDIGKAIGSPTKPAEKIKPVGVQATSTPAKKVNTLEAFASATTDNIAVKTKATGFQKQKASKNEDMRRMSLLAKLSEKKGS